jgi:UDP-glucose 4-epimerase
MQKLIITGAAGFIGSTLSEYFFKKGFNVVGIDNMKYGGQKDNLKWTLELNGNTQNTWKFYEIDVCSEHIKDIIDQDSIVIHCAAIAPLPMNQEYPYLSITNNIGGTVSLLEACRIKGVKHFLFASTSAVYENDNIFPSEESKAIEKRPFLLYSSGKLYAEECVKNYNEVYNLPYTIFRFFNVYGPHHDCLRQNPPLIGYLVREFLNGKQPILHSDGKQERDYVYVDDVVALIDNVINNLKIASNKTYNICSNQTSSVNKIVSIVQSIMNVHVDPIFRESKLLWEKNTILYDGMYPIKPSIVEKEVSKYSLGSYDSANKDFGWIPKISLQEGLTRTVKYTQNLLSKN